jgi:hypothetical protein
VMRGKAFLKPKPGAEIWFLDAEAKPFFSHVKTRGHHEELSCEPMCPACIAGLPLYEMKQRHMVLPMWLRNRLAWVDGEAQWVRAQVFGRGCHVTVRELKKLKGEEDV